MFSFRVEKTQMFMVDKEPMTSGSVDVYMVHFDFSSDWDGFYRTAVFKSGSLIKNIWLGVDTECLVPWEVLVLPNQKIQVGVYGEDTNGAVLPTVWADLGPVLVGVVADGSEPSPTPDLWDQELIKKQDKLTGTPGQVVGFNADGAAESLTLTPGHNVEITQNGTDLTIGAVVPGENLIINGDFRRPVNRNGKTEYVGKGYTIDRWVSYGAKVSLENRCLVLQKANGVYSINQKLSHNLFDALLTFSALTSDGELLCGSGMLSSGSAEWDYEILSVSGTVSLILQRQYGYLAAAITVDPDIEGAQAKIVAVKLELGDHQTLARQNENGDWEIIDPPDYDLQYALCSLYSPITGEWVGYQHSNENILDNAYWANLDSIIDQRNGHIVDSGVTYYSDSALTTSAGTTLEAMTAGYVGKAAYGTIAIDGTTYYVAAADVVRGYTGRYRNSIDRWRIYDCGIIKLTDQGIRCKNVIDFAQRVEVSRFPVEEPFTISVLTDQGLGSVTLTFSGNPDERIRTNIGNGVFINFIYNWGTSGSSLCAIQSVGSLLIAAKLELGPVQTLAHQDASGNWVLNDPPPNKALELAKCQRYQYEVLDRTAPVQAYIALCKATSSTQMLGLLPLPSTLREGRNPSLITDCSVDTPYKAFGIYDSGYDVDALIHKIDVFSKVSSGVILIAEGTGLIPGNDYYIYVDYQNQHQFLLDLNL